MCFCYSSAFYYSAKYTDFPDSIMGIKVLRKCCHKRKSVKELQLPAADAVITEGRLLNRGTKQEIREWVKSL